jgi:predicted permease
MFFGILLAVLCALFLLRNLGILDASVWGILWPVVIVLLGLSMIFKKNRKFWE